MKKKITLLSATFVFLICCLASFNAFAAESISNAAVELDKTSYTYTASQCKPNVKVTLTASGSSQQSVVKTLVKDTDYTVSYSNNVKCGTASVTVTGKGAYSGSVTKHFTITQASISSPKLTVVKNATAGSAPKIKLTYKSQTLVSGTDYTASFSGYSKAGLKKCKVVLNGKGNFKGSKTIYLHVYPKKVSGVTYTALTTTSVTLKWNSQSDYGATGYKVYFCDKNGNNLDTYKKVSSNSCKVTGLKANKIYYFRVMAYRKEDSKTLLGDKSSVYIISTKPNGVTNKKTTKSSDKKKLVVEWSKTGCSGYVIQYSTDKSFKKGVKQVYAGSDKTSKKISIKKSNKVYYARVRAYKKFKRGSKTKTIYGSWSKKLSTSYSKLYASYTTNYVNNANRTTNLKLACKAIDGTIVKPGETFSFNKVVGKRTAAKGYKPATIFTGGSGTAQSTGGGICQVASTMFNTTLLANMSIVERHQHSQRVSYCPLGRDAAIYWGSEDYKFKNNTDYPIKIKMNCADGKISCKFYTCYNVSPKKVTLKVSQSGRNFTLRRYVNGKVNYTTRSNY